MTNDRFRPGRTRRAFTIVELLVVIVVLLVVAALSTPLYTSFLNKQRLQGVVRLVDGAFIQARGEAIRRQEPVVMAINTTDRELSPWVFAVTLPGGGICIVNLSLPPASACLLRPAFDPSDPAPTRDNVLLAVTRLAGESVRLVLSPRISKNVGSNGVLLIRFYPDGTLYTENFEQTSAAAFIAAVAGENPATVEDFDLCVRQSGMGPRAFMDFQPSTGGVRWEMVP